MSEPVVSRPAPLHEWGYDSYFEQHFRATHAPGEQPGRIVRSELRSALVALEGGEADCAVHPSVLSGGGIHPTTGDFVAVDRDRLITRVLERRTAVVRASPDPGRGDQVLAANVDTVLVAEPLGERWRPRRLERLLVVAWQSGAVPVVVLTKADRCDDLPSVFEAAMGLAPGVSVHAVSALDGEGLDEVAAELAPLTTSVIIGRSGAGKSTLANALSGETAGLPTAAVRDDGKGRHTTVRRELVRLVNGSLLIDTPGIRAIGLSDAGEAIGEAFVDVEALVAECRFNDCGHGNEPGCAVTLAIREGRLHPERLESYRRLRREQLRYEAKSDARLRAARNAERRRFAKQVRNLPKR